MASHADEPRAASRGRTGWLSRFGGTAGLCIGIGGLLVGLGLGLFGDEIRWAIGTTAVERWPRMESIELRLDLRNAPEFRAHARLALAEVRERRIPLLLNRALEPTSAATIDGAAVEWSEGKALRSGYHRESRLLWFDLGREPSADGERVELELDYGGRAADGSESRDWRGIVLLAPDEVRMSEQSVFYPQVALDASGPGVARARGELEVQAPAAFELFAPGREVAASRAAAPGAREWRFEFEQPTVFSLLGGLRTRLELEENGIRVVSLLCGPHAKLGPRLIDDARATLRFFSERFGPISGEVLGIIEIQGRGDSYNWASQGVAAFESGAFQEHGLPAEKLGHELAHLWWGQAVASSGEGERFLTEGLAEYSSWRWVEEVLGIEAARRLAQQEREQYLDKVHELGSDPALARVDFKTPGYTQLAYSKGALVLRAAEQQLGRDAFDAGLRRYVEASRRTGGTLEGLLIALCGSAEQGAALMPWVVRDGHAHLELEQPVCDEEIPATRGTVIHVPCPKGIAEVALDRIDLRFAGESEERQTCSFDARGRAAFARTARSDAILLDEDVHALAAGKRSHSFRGLQLLRSDPAQGAVDVPYLLPRIELEFDRALAPLPPNARSRLRAALIEHARERDAKWPSIAEPRLEQDGKRLVLELTHPLEPGREILVAFDGALDDSNRIPITGVELSFRAAKAAEHDRPVVIATAPEAGSTEVDFDLEEIRIEFSEPMRSGRGYSGTEVRELGQQGWKFPLQPRSHDSHWTKGGRVLVYELSAPLEPGARYMLPLRGAFRDLAGNYLVDFEYRFETRR